MLICFAELGIQTEFHQLLKRFLVLLQLRTKPAWRFLLMLYKIFLWLELPLLGRRVPHLVELGCQGILHQVSWELVGWGSDARLPFPPETAILLDWPPELGWTWVHLPYWVGLGDLFFISCKVISTQVFSDVFLRSRGNWDEFGTGPMLG